VEVEVGMKLDLNPLTFTAAHKIIFWCAEHGIDPEKSNLLVRIWQSTDRNVGDSDELWVLDIPDHYITWFRMKGWL
jgi:hypothetical protein